MNATETPETYNGWTNYPTWAVKLWLDNDHGLYMETRERVAEILAEPEARSEYWTLEQSHLYSVEDMLKDWVEELAAYEYSKPTMVADLIGYALAEVNWRELAGACISDASDV